MALRSPSPEVPAEVEAPPKAENLVEGGYARGATPTAPITGGASAAWLSATTALTHEERQLMDDASKAYQLFLLHDPRAADIWPEELQGLRQAARVIFCRKPEALKKTNTGVHQ
eukprot:symbB.v1.2.021410.t1/scaffold1813.1/size100325/6